MVGRNLELGFPAAKWAFVSARPKTWSQDPKLPSLPPLLLLLLLLPASQLSFSDSGDRLDREHANVVA